MMRVALLVLVIALIPAGAAEQTFHFTADSLSLESTTTAEVQKIPLSQRGLISAGKNSVADWSYTLKSAANVGPVTTTIHFEVTKATPVPQTAYVAGVANACTWYLRLAVGENWWYYCNNQYQNSVLQPGLYKLDFKWNPDLAPNPGSAGTAIEVALSTGAVSDDGSPSIFILVGSTAADSNLVLKGTNEPVPAAMPGPAGNATTSPTEQPTPSTSGSASPSSSASSSPTTSPQASESGPAATASASQTGSSSAPAAGASSSPVGEPRGSPGFAVGFLVMALATIVLARRRL